MREIHGVLEEVAPDIARHAPNHGPERAGDIARSIGSNARLLNETDWMPRVEFAEGLRQQILTTRQRVNILNVLWLTGRSMNDLCSTTQQALIHGLLGRSMTVTFVNADSNCQPRWWGFTHVSRTKPDEAFNPEPSERRCKRGWFPPPRRTQASPWWSGVSQRGSCLNSNGKAFHGRSWTEVHRPMLVCSVDFSGEG